MLVEGKVAIVTGAAAGIGRASALAFAREGARVAVADVDEEGGRETVQLIEKSGAEAFFVSCDISSAADALALVETTVDRFGRLDCAVNNAGVGLGQALVAEIDPEKWERTIAVNLTGTWNCLRAQLPYMAEHGGGAIVAMSSATSQLGVKKIGAYAASKSGINGLVRSAAADYARVGIRVNALLPGAIGTELVERAIATNPAVREHHAKIPMGRVGLPDEVAEAAVWLCSDRSSYVTGVSLLVDGGETLG